MSDTIYIDLSWHALNKIGEELCGDKVEVVKDDKRTIVVLSDGLGSGVKANILSTLTAKIMITMLDKGEDLKETIDTITGTLPICLTRKIAYSTFTIIEINHETLHCRMIEFDNPPIFICRQNKILTPNKEKFESSGKVVWLSSLDLIIGDELTICSDGVIHAGVGELLNHGWEWEHVAEFLRHQNLSSAEKLNRRLLEACNKLYEFSPGDDATAVTIKVRRPNHLQLLTGPPINREKDHELIEVFMRSSGKKVVCGGTAANIMSRELNREICTNITYDDPSVPPIAIIKGIDLVTEGVLTLKMALDKLKDLNQKCEEPDFSKNDGVSRLLKLFMDSATHITFWVGRAINPAHQNPDFPVELGIKLAIVKEIISELKYMGKEVKLTYTDG